jgi:hypothetical protein
MAEDKKIHGNVARGFEPVRAAFATQLPIRSIRPKRS